MLFKSFRKVFTDCEFMVRVYHKNSNYYDSDFKASYLTTEGNINRVINLDRQKARVTDISYNKAVQLNQITVEVDY